jgi:hypothetical protein
MSDFAVSQLVCVQWPETFNWLRSIADSVFWIEWRNVPPAMSGRNSSSIGDKSSHQSLDFSARIA